MRVFRIERIEKRRSQALEQPDHGSSSGNAGGRRPRRPEARPEHRRHRQARHRDAETDRRHATAPISARPPAHRHRPRSASNRFARRNASPRFGSLRRGREMDEAVARDRQPSRDSAACSARLAKPRARKSCKRSSPKDLTPKYLDCGATLSALEQRGNNSHHRDRGGLLALACA